jgi:hypothetical protein
MFSTYHQDRSPRFVTNRTTSDDGYSNLLVIDDSFNFFLLLFRQYAGCFVATPLGRWELWSPNSCILPFYPGVVTTVPLAEVPKERAERKYDGHLGRYDYSLYPQAFDPLRLWQGFIVWLINVTCLSSLQPEFYQLLDVWQVSSPQTLTHGSICPAALRALELCITDITREMDSWSALHENSPSCGLNNPCPLLSITYDH